MTAKRKETGCGTMEVQTTIRFGLKVKTVEQEKTALSTLIPVPAFQMYHAIGPSTLSARDIIDLSIDNRYSLN